MKNALWWLAPFSAGCKTVFNSFPVLGSDIIYRALNGIAVFLSGANTNRTQNFICFATKIAFIILPSSGKTRETEKKMVRNPQRGEFAPEMFFTAMVNQLAFWTTVDSMVKLWVLCGFSSGIVGTEIFATGTCQEDSFVCFNLAVKRAKRQWKGCLMKSETIETNPEISHFLFAVESRREEVVSGIFWMKLWLFRYDESRYDESMVDFE